MQRHPKRPRPLRPIPVLVGQFQIFKSGASRFDVRDPYHLAVSLPWPAFAIGFLAVWLGLNLFFACLYVLGDGAILNARPRSFFDAFFFSIETLATVGYGVMAPATPYGHMISAMEIVSGMVFTAIFTGLLFVRFSRAKAKIAYADDAVVTMHNGRQTLMLRLANARMTLMINANARLFVLLGEHSSEGRFFRRIHELRLVQAHLPLFVMPWTLMHPIDEDSPLHGCDAASIVSRDTWLFVALEVRDQALATVVYDMKNYSPTNIRFGMRYAEAVTFDDAGQVTADLFRISMLEPETVSEPDVRRAR